MTDEVPRWAELFQSARGELQDQMTALRQGFDTGSFVGKVVTNWCQKCRKWPLEYVSVSRLQSLSVDERFTCTMCGSKVPLMTDDRHTLLSNVKKVVVR